MQQQMDQLVYCKPFYLAYHFLSLFIWHTISLPEMVDENI